MTNIYKMQFSHKFTCSKDSTTPILSDLKMSLALKTVYTLSLNSAKVAISKNSSKEKDSKKIKLSKL